MQDPIELPAANDGIDSPAAGSQLTPGLTERQLIDPTDGERVGEVIASHRLFRMQRVVGLLVAVYVHGLRPRIGQ